MAATLAFDISSTKGTVRLTSGKLFRGGEYRLALTLDGTAVTDEVAMVRIYGDVRSDTRGDEICVAEATASDGYVVKTDTEAIEHLFTIHAGAEIVPVRVVVYVTEAIVADGRTMLYWSPTMAIVDGKPIDTRGEKGDDGYTPVKGKDYFDGKDGKPGPKGDDGHTPEKGVDYFDGKDGEDGAPGKDGKSAYAAAVEGGFKGTEEEFNAALKEALGARGTLEDIESLIDGIYDDLDTFNVSVETLTANIEATKALQEEANMSATSARDAAIESQSWRDEAEEFRNDAVAAKDSAVTAAQSAAGNAGVVSKAEGRVQGLVSEANAAKESAETAKESAQKSAEQAESAKTAIGDVGGRLEAVETSVAEKVPYISPLLLCMFNLVQAKVNYRVANVYFCHEGFLFTLFARSYVTEFLRPKDNNWSKVDLGVIKLIVIYSAEPKTVIYSVNGTKNLKSVVSGQGASLAIATEEIATLPANVSAYSDVYAYEESHGFLVTTNGLILNSDLTESGTTFATTSGKGLLKVGDVFKYFDTSAKAFIQMTVGADGVPALTKNGYTHDANQTYIPTKTNWGYCRFTQNRLTGCSDWNNGYFYKQMEEDGFLQCVISDPFELANDRNNGYVFVTDGDRILRIVGAGGNTSYPTFSCEAIGLRGARMDYNHPIGGVFTSYNTIGAFRDLKGNIFIAEGESFSKSSRTFYTILVVKEA